MDVKPSYIAAAAGGIMAAQALVLAMLNHPLICPCGYVALWDGVVRGMHNSQMVLDWYSFLHVMYGMILFFGAWLLHKRFGWKISFLFLAVVLISFSWEIFENTRYAIHHYQLNSATSNYYGDSILNSLTDTLCVMLGFGLAAWLPWWAGAGLFLGVTLLTTLVLRDNIFIGTLVFIFPIKPVLNWQAAAAIYH